MSNDLISRSALLEEINNLHMRITGSVNAAEIAIMEETKKSIAKMVDEQPTAYDMDKVVERLEEEGMYEDAPVYEGDRETDYYIRLGKAVEIVRSGGIE